MNPPKGEIESVILAVECPTISGSYREVEVEKLEVEVLEVEGAEPEDLEDEAEVFTAV